jgi:hypothetical protein
VADFYYRTEDIRDEKIGEYFVETQQDREIIDALKSTKAVVLVGSRGVGKSFLLKMAKAELMEQFSTHHIFPVYLTFQRSSLIQTNDPQQFHHWMLGYICNRIVRALQKKGLLVNSSPSLSILTGGGDLMDQDDMPTKLEIVTRAYEESWKNPGEAIKKDVIPTINEFKDAIEDICEELKIRRFALFIDEAAHIFLSKQQRQFFTLFRDLRSPYLTCNAAVYPGVTSYGDSFQPTHDAVFYPINRNFLSDDYVRHMQDMVEKQLSNGESDPKIRKGIEQNRGNFELLAYASGGNPRALLKTLSRTPNLNSSQVNAVIREYYRTEIWAEHTGLAEKFVGHREWIDWGRQFIENEVLPKIASRNERFRDRKETTCFFWVHRDAPAGVEKALRLLSYTGIVTEHAKAIKSSHSELGARYYVNPGCVFALEATPAFSDSISRSFAKHIQVDRMIEFGSNNPYFSSLQFPRFDDPNMAEVLQRQLDKPLSTLDIAKRSREKLEESKFKTIGDLLRAAESDFRKIYYIGEKRSRRIYNTAMVAVFEYLSG